MSLKNAGVAQLAERELPKLEVMGSTPTARCFAERFWAKKALLQKARTLAYVNTPRPRAFFVSAFYLQNHCGKTRGLTFACRAEIRDFFCIELLFSWKLL